MKGGAGQPTGLSAGRARRTKSREVSDDICPSYFPETFLPEFFLTNFLREASDGSYLPEDQERNERQVMVSAQGRRGNCRQWSLPAPPGPPASTQKMSTCNFPKLRTCIYPKCSPASTQNCPPAHTQNSAPAST